MPLPMRSSVDKSVRRRHRGVAAVELALLILPLIVLFSSVAEYGRALMQYNTLAKAVRNSARFLTFVSATDPGYAQKANEALCLAVYGNRTCTGTPLVPGLTTDMVSIHDSVSDGGNYGAVGTGLGAINLVEVRIEGYIFQPMLPGLNIVPGLADLKSFNAISATMRQVI